MKNELERYIDPKKIGSTLVAAAIEKHKEEQSAKVVKQVHDILDRIQTFTIKKKQCEQNIVLFAAQMDAIKKGEFTFHGQSGMTIVFDDATLNREWIGC